MPETKAQAAARLAQHVAGVARLRRAAYADQAGKGAMMTLKGWQSARLARTYPDLLASPRYRDAALFFLNDLYGPKDFSQRDADIERILPKLIALLPGSALSAIADSVELDEVSEDLDGAVLRAHTPIETADQISEASYAAAYRAGSSRPLRQRQIELIAHIGHALDHLTHIPMLLTTVKLMRTPARMAGLVQLQHFLEHGFVTVRDLHGADEFIDIISTRETAIMERLFAGAANPFSGAPETAIK